MVRSPFKTSNFDMILFISFVILILLGLIGIYSTGNNLQPSNEANGLFLKQFIWFAVGLIVFFIALGTNYNIYYRYSEYIYAVMILLLLVTLVLGTNLRNTKGWIALFGVHFQFSEFAKISVIFLLAKYLSSNVSKLRTFRDYAIPIAIVLFPMLLILAQPDLGTALVLLPILIALLYISGMEDIYILILLIVGIVSTGLPLWMSYFQLMEPDSTFWLYNLFLNKSALLFVIMFLLFLIIVFALLYIFTNNRSFRKINFSLIVMTLSFSAAVFLFHFLKLYHKKRLLAFINPDIDRLGAGYNIIQSTISIGSGQLAGKGFLKGTQSLYGFLPAQSTDFIFSALAEQFGLLVTLVIFGLFITIIARGISIIRESKDLFGSLVATGIVTFISFHLIVNIGMITGFMPVIGLPLPFMSYGGSSLVTFMFSMAVLINIRMNRFINL